MCHSNLAYDGKTTSINSVIQKINKSRCQGGSEALQNSVTPHVIVLFSFCTPSCTTNSGGLQGAPIYTNFVIDSSREYDTTTMPLLLTIVLQMAHTTTIKMRRQSLLELRVESMAWPHQTLTTSCFKRNHRKVYLGQK